MEQESGACSVCHPAVSQLCFELSGFQRHPNSSDLSTPLTPPSGRLHQCSKDPELLFFWCWDFYSFNNSPAIALK